MDVTLRDDSARRKGFYDLYGEAALKEGIPDGAGGTLR